MMMSGHGSIETAVKAIKLGAYDYIEKPLSLENVTLRVKHALDQHRLEQENRNLRTKVERKFELIGQAPVMQQLKQLIETAGPTNSRVLIGGENGTGKELVARAIHQHSHRANCPFVAVNCAAIPETLIESELFGHERGAFSGATTMKRGQFEQADGGTLFLDEIADMSLSTQAKVLRALQEQQFTRVGGTKLIKVDVRVLAASNKDLLQEIEKGTFREDLFYRLNVVPIVVPTLRDRREDIPLLVKHFLRVHAEEQGLKIKQVSPEAMEVFMQYEWPGNIRELRNLIERLMIMVPGPVIEAAHASVALQVRPQMSAAQSAAGAQPVNTLLTRPYNSLRDARNAFEKEFIARKLREHHWNISRTAEDLKIERSHLHRKIKLLDVEMRPEM
jgi:two-component system nitrogen regulation response regulator NtrX